MILFKKATDLRNYLDDQSKKGRKLGFVPTMGALHPGHISLITRSKNECALTVCSIFVNPAQFNDPSDFEKYPLTPEQDIEMLEKAGCDLLFLPPLNEVYPEGMDISTHFELGYPGTVLEGLYRPGHFQGVCRVVKRLLEIVKPGYLYMGQKDYQQCMVIAKLLGLTGLGMDTKLVICPTLRENDGLAMSSRNRRLNNEERIKALAIYQSLLFIRQNIKPGITTTIINKAKAIIEKNKLRVEYVSLSDAENLEPVDKWDGKQKIVALMAAYMNEVRLIDNMVI